MYQNFLFISANAPAIKFEDPSSVSTHICLTSYLKTTEAICYKLLMSFQFSRELVAVPVSAEVVGRQCFEKRPDTIDSY